MHTKDLEDRFGPTQVTSILARLRQIEAINPQLFQILVARAVMDSNGGLELPIPKDQLKTMTPEQAARETLIRITAEGLR
jgi:hypothetical protein